MTTPEYSPVVQTARDYYNSPDADNFYHAIWGGEDIHVGLYESPDEPVLQASRRTVERMASLLPGLGPGSRVLDLGAGYGGAARYLAGQYGCHVTALNISEVENERDREMNRERGLDGLIEVIDGSFEEVPADDASFDVVWSQDAILHSGDRDRVISEVARVLRPGGIFVFTDPMQADDCPEGVLAPILERIHLDTLGSPAFYRAAAARAGLSEVGFEDLTPHLVAHYSAVLRVTERRGPDLKDRISPAYLERMKNGLRNWIEGGKKGYLCWGIFRFSKGQ